MSSSRGLGQIPCHQMILMAIYVKLTFQNVLTSLFIEPNSTAKFNLCVEKVVQTTFFDLHWKKLISLNQLARVSQLMVWWCWWVYWMSCSHCIIVLWQLVYQSTLVEQSITSQASTASRTQPRWSTLSRHCIVIWRARLALRLWCVYDVLKVSDTTQCSTAWANVCFMSLKVVTHDPSCQPCGWLVCQLHKTNGDRAFPVAAAKVWNMLPPTITSLPSSAHWRWNCSVDHTATHTTGNSSIDTATRDTQRPWSFLKTCVAMKFVADDDDDPLVRGSAPGSRIAESPARPRTPRARQIPLP